MLDKFHFTSPRVHCQPLPDSIRKQTNNIVTLSNEKREREKKKTFRSKIAKTK